MQKVLGNILNNSPFAKAVRVEDLLFYDEPILTHYIYKDRDILKYLLDYDDELTRYLIFQVDNYDLFKLVSGNASIRKLIEYSSEDFTFLYIVDENSHGESVTTYQIILEELAPKYLPNDNSVLASSSIARLYEPLIERYRETHYIESLREKSFYLKFEPTSTAYDGSLGLVELTKLLNLVTTSFKNFTKIDFLKYFHDKIADKNKLNKLYNSITDFIDPRTVKFEFGSFEVGIAIDKTMKMGKAGADVQEWMNQVEEKYKDTVLQLDYSDEGLVNEMVERFNYSDKEIESIYKPILKISQDSDYNFEFKPTEDSKYKPIVVTNQQVFEKLSPVPPKRAMEDEALPTEIEYINVLVAKPKGKQLTTKVKLDNTLFSSTDKHILTNAHFAAEGLPITFEIELIVNLSQSDGMAVVSTVYDKIEFEESGPSADLGPIMSRLIKRIAEYIFEKDNIGMDPTAG